jgi:hypothetical protein
MQTQQGVVVGADVDGLAMPRLTEWLKALGISLPSASPVCERLCLSADSLAPSVVRISAK